MNQNNKIKLKVEDVSKTFITPANEKIEALKNVDLEVEDVWVANKDVGEFLVLLGPSGCGKSTLLRIIAGLDTPDSGSVEFNGHPIKGPSRERGMVFQKYTSFFWWNVLHNVEYGLKINGMEKRQRRQRARQWIKAVGLEGFEKAYPQNLSGGMQQRLALARALAVNPKMILMDEPFGALDAQTRVDMQQLLLRVWEETAATVIFVTHDVDEAIFLADQIFIMSARPGTIVETLKIPFPRPRTLDVKQTDQFHELQSFVLQRLKASPGRGQVRVTV